MGWELVPQIIRFMGNMKILDTYKKLLISLKLRKILKRDGPKMLRTLHVLKILTK